MVYKIILETRILTGRNFFTKSLYYYSFFLYLTYISSHTFARFNFKPQ